MTAIEVACPVCDQQPGEQCTWVHGEPLVMNYHASRIEAAAAMTQSSNPVSREEFNEAVLSTGLV